MEPINAPESIDLIALAPVLVLSVFAMGVLVLDLWAGKNKTLLMFISLVGLLMTAISAFAKHPLPAFAFTDSYIVDHLSIFFICIFTLSSALTILLSFEYNERKGIKAGEYYALILLCTVGMIILASSTDLIMIFLGIEIVSICLYVLAGFRRDDPIQFTVPYREPNTSSASVYALLIDSISMDPIMIILESSSAPSSLRVVESRPANTRCSS